MIFQLLFMISQLPEQLEIKVKTFSSSPVHAKRVPYITKIKRETYLTKIKTVKCKFVQSDCCFVFCIQDLATFFVLLNSADNI